MSHGYAIYTSTAKDDPIVPQILKNLVDYNNSQVVKILKPFVVALKSGDAILAGAECASAWDWMHIKLLWVEESDRRKGYGSKLLKLIENEALKRKCYGIHLDTFSFQAKDFYLKSGFRIFGEIDNHPQGHKRYYLSKNLNPRASD